MKQTLIWSWLLTVVFGVAAWVDWALMVANSAANPMSGPSTFCVVTGALALVCLVVAVVATVVALWKRVARGRAAVADQPA